MSRILLIVLALFAQCTHAQTDYKGHLESLNKNDINSISLAADRLNIITNEPTSYYDDAFFAFRTFYFEVINTANNTLMPSIEEKLYNYHESVISGMATGITDHEVRNFLSQVSANGCVISMTEGSYYIDEKPGFLAGLFNPLVSDYLKEFLTIRAEELKETFSEDAMLMLPLDKLGDRIATWEAFIASHPDSKITDEAKDFYKTYLGTFISGMNNTDTYENNKLLPEWRTAYTYFIIKHDGTQSAEFISKYYSLLEQHEFAYTNEVDQFLKENQSMYSDTGHSILH